MSEQIRRVIHANQRRRGLGKKHGVEDASRVFRSATSFLHSATCTQVSRWVWVSVNSGYEPTECSSGPPCRWGSRNWRSSLVKILTLGGKLCSRCLAERTSIKLARTVGPGGRMHASKDCLNRQAEFVKYVSQWLDSSLLSIRTCCFNWLIDEIIQFTR